jgi:hypothetical protein
MVQWNYLEEEVFSPKVLLEQGIEQNCKANTQSQRFTCNFVNTQTVVRHFKETLQ